jgi:uncharacterized protein YqgC (DUF456 family)
MEPIIVSVIVWAIILVGLVGTVVPVLPGVGLIFGGILLHALYFGIDEVGMTTLIALGVVAVLSVAFDFLASAYGASRFGSTKWGVWGSVVGGILGIILLNLPGLILGVFLGAVAGEMIFAKRDMHQSLRVGWGSVLGFFAGSILKFILGLLMIIVFLVKILS